MQLSLYHSYNLTKFQAKNNTLNTKKDIGKWCEFHKSSTHNKGECRVKKSLVTELKASKLDAGSDSESKLDKELTKGIRSLM